MGAGYFCGAWATEGNHICKIIKLTRQNEDLKGQVQRLSVNLEINKRELGGYKATFDRLELRIRCLEKGPTESTAISVRPQPSASG